MTDDLTAARERLDEHRREHETDKCWCPCLRDAARFRALADELGESLIDENAAACNEFCSGEHSQQCLDARAALAKWEASRG